MIATYKALEGQSLYDICLQTYGTLDKLSNGVSAFWKFIQDNGIVNINNTIWTGKVFTFDTSLIYDAGTYQKNLDKDIVYATNEDLNMVNNILNPGLLTGGGVQIVTGGGDHILSNQ